MMQTLLETLNQNPFFSGGLSLMVRRARRWPCCARCPASSGRFLQRRLSITVEIPDRDPAFRWVQVWLAAQPYAGVRRDLSLATTWVPADAESDTAVVFDPDDAAATGPASRVKFLLSPAPGTHLMLYRNRLLILHRSRRDLQNGNARTFQENLTLQILGGSRALVEQLLGEARKLACPRTPGVSILTARYESWETTSWQPRRPLESLVLADGAPRGPARRPADVLRLPVVVRRARASPTAAATCCTGRPGTARRRWCWPRRAS